MILESPEELYHLAESIGLIITEDDTPQKVLTRLFHLAERVDDIPDLSEL